MDMKFLLILSWREHFLVGFQDAWVVDLEDEKSLGSCDLVAGIDRSRNPSCSTSLGHRFYFVLVKGGVTFRRKVGRVREVLLKVDITLIRTSQELEKGNMKGVTITGHRQDQGLAGQGHILLLHTEDIRKDINEVVGLRL
eukprot:m.66049 g.66049  ORF g.66049 m.66049 type:complete len:140 (+) comp35359_c1_seq2:355-774(+)